MTREEAVNKVIDSRYGPAALSNVGCQAEAHARVREYVALGMLKLDEPKGLPQKLRDFVSDTRLVQGGAMERLGALQHVLADCGLKIVEK